MNGIQCRMARAALGWSTQDLASKAGVGLNTVNRFESGNDARVSSAARMRAALEAGGVEFTNGRSQGVRMRELDFDAIDAGNWSDWRIMPSQEAAVTEFRKEWGLPITGQGPGGAQIWFAIDPAQRIRVGEVDYLDGKWVYRSKEKAFLPLKGSE